MPSSPSSYDRLHRTTSSTFNITSSSDTHTSSTHSIRFILLFTATVTTFLLIAATTVTLTLFITHTSSSSSSTTHHPSQAISETCSNARYPSLCVSTLVEFPGAMTVSKSTQLVHMSVNVTLRKFGSALSGSVEIVNWEMDTLQRSAYDDCVELLEESIDLLAKSLDSVDATQGIGGDSEDVMTWLSAALTNQDTCTEGLSTTTSGQIKQEMSNRMKDLSELVSNCLAIYASTHLHNNDFAGVPINNRRRRLLTQQQPKKNNDVPNWIWKMDKEILTMMKLGVAAPAGTGMQADVVVAGDGTGTVKTLTEALKLVPSNNAHPFIIHVKPGRYEEPNLKIGRKKTNVWLLGDGKGKTVITGGKNVAHDKITTFHTAAFAASGSGFFTRDITFENYAGPQSHQAVALRVSADHAVIYRCEIKAYQDTLYVHSNRQFYRDCDIYGTVDFIFGNAAVVFQHCNLIARKPLPLQKNTITAQNRRDPNQNTGMSIHDCVVGGEGVTYLGRPWKMYSTVVYMMSFIDRNVMKQGWLEWNATVGTNNLYYGEYMNVGPGSDLTGRVKWKGVHNVMTREEAARFTVGTFIAGGTGWLAATGVAFQAGLTR